MTRVLICNRLQRDFAMVPDALWRAELPFAAKGVACYLLSLRHGAMPYVAEMEAAMGLGRDARRKAFRALEKAGFLDWVEERDKRGRIVAKMLVLDPLVFGAAEAAAHAPESQADGAEPAESVHAPEKPAGGKHVPPAVVSRPCGDGKSGGLLREREKKGRAGRAKASSCSISGAASSPASRPSPRPPASSVPSGEPRSPEVVNALRVFHRLPLADPERGQIAAWLAAQGVDVPGWPGGAVLRRAGRPELAGRG